ncbi:MAG: hypothetical protein UZ22_OP11002000395 [Microgenomates bacterium OLB23]|nr:MAG: hypothetical protein UZ22_OP11002000395 [Microgenomates bacterium OLB23]
MRIGPFYFDSKEVFLIIAVALLAAALYFNIQLIFFEPQALLTLAIIFLILKGLLPSTHNEAFFIHALVTVFLTMFLPLFQVILFYAVTFVFFKMLRVI